MHVVSEPPILYLGTPVVLISSLNEDGTTNLAPMSSAFWLGWRCILGLAAAAKTAQNLRRLGECVLNIPSESEVSGVDRLALTTGSDPVPSYKVDRGYRYEGDKFARAGFTRAASETVRPERVHECPIQLEAVIEAEHGIAEGDAALKGRIVTFEARITRVHVQHKLLAAGEANRIDPDKWRPLIMSFQKFYGLKSGQLQTSRLSSIPEAVYRSPDVDKTRRVAEPA
ncbi:MAG TPA: flavin reductase family protein [Steroidobacteraceae bacterium]|jgi:flavin reductase (DIM6/NTAB) family NADH-FMN oxidoreductase RutF